MNILHRRYCRSDAWRQAVHKGMMPWVLRDVELGANVLEIGPGPGVTADWLRGSELVRTSVALATIAPIAFLMGMPMPSGLRLLAVRGPDLVPWAWGVNGVASVLGSILAIILAMELGFTGVLAIAAGVYALAALVRVR